MKSTNDIGVLFDLDGVLLDSESTYTTFWQRVDEIFPSGIENFAQVIKGSSMEAILQHYPSQQVRDQVVEMLDRFQADMSYDFFPGALEFVEQLSLRGIACGIVTSSDVKKMNALYGQHPHFKDRFQAIVMGDMVQCPKPDPECFLMGARLLHRDISHCFIFEDSVNGLLAARASGAAKVIALSTTLPAEQVSPMADITISHFNATLAQNLFKEYCN